MEPTVPDELVNNIDRQNGLQSRTEVKVRVVIISVRIRKRRTNEVVNRVVRDLVEIIIAEM